ncbi:beta-1,3-galactosyltransferase 1-like [Onthophagus taurus]|uniref:beta-1,3-galactosyltransferase 1-like n=1 Tax=Onthophagus taurus TaxID=166361 RepID=UPI000C20E88E|nr:beta-1,3-galactosyltransferase 1-like [Onthophagus taurus]
MKKKAKPFMILGLIAIVGYFGWFCWVVNNHRYDLGPVDGWENNRSRDVSLYIQPDNLTSILLPGKFCKNKTDLLIMITSTPTNFDERNVIRETWASDKIIQNFNVDYYFMLGEVTNDTLQDQLTHEYNEHNDIIQEQFLDTYNNLTLKSLMTLKVVTKHCTNSVKYIMKTDDDMFVNVPLLIKYLKRRRGKSDLFGSLIQKAPPVRQTSSKWKAPYYLYDKDAYPDYLSGTGYVMSLDVVQKLYKTSFDTPIYYLEDVYITGMLPVNAKLKPKNHPGFSYLKREMDMCIYLTAITAHHVNETEMRLLYDLLRRTNLQKDCKKKPQNKRQKTPQRAIRRVF